MVGHVMRTLNAGYGDSPGGSSSELPHSYNIISRLGPWTALAPRRARWLRQDWRTFLQAVPRQQDLPRALMLTSVCDLMMPRKPKYVRRNGGAG